MNQGSKAVLIALLLIPLFFTISCSNVQVEKANSPSTAGTNTPTFANQAITISQLVGAWVAKCDSDPANNYSGTEQMFFSGDGKYTYSVADYSNANCSGTPDILTQVSGTFNLTGLNAQVSGATGIVFNVSQVTMTPGTQAIANDMNFHLECGDTTWQGGVAKSISGNNACLNGLGESGADLVAINGVNLYWGNDQQNGIDTANFLTKH